MILMSYEFLNIEAFNGKTSENFKFLKHCEMLESESSKMLENYLD